MLICLASTPWLERGEVPCRRYSLEYEGFLKKNIITVILRLRNILLKERIDILQTFFQDSLFVGFLGSLASPRKPVLISSRRDMGLGPDNPWYHSVYKAILPHINKRFHKIVANSLRVRSYVAETEKTPVERIVVINNGIEMPSGVDEVPDLFKTYKADIWIALTANLKPVKRIDLFLESLRLLKSRTKIDFHSIILGTGRLMERMQSMAAAFGIFDRVHFVGSVDDVYAYLKNVNIGVLCSDSEGLSNAIMEYMACGLPVVATAVGGNTELVDETNGILIPPGDAFALCAAIETLANDMELRRRMGAASQKKISERYTWNIIMEQWQNLYRSLYDSIIDR